jgi:hypothetical protein
VQNQLGNQNAAQQKALQEQFAQQGQGGSGASMQARMLASQGNANSGASAGATVAANAQARALQALQGQGQLASSMNDQQFAQDARKADATNVINQFNANNRQQVALTNQANAQAANNANFQKANDVASKNVDITNQQRLMPISTAQQQFTNQFGVNKAVGGAQLDAGRALTDQGNKQATTSAGWIGDAVKAAPDIIKGAGAIASWFSDEKVKKDVGPADQEVESMMDTLVGKRFKYDEGHPADDGKQHVGPMAQSVEKAGLTTMDTPDGKKVVDDEKMSAFKLAALNNLHRRVGQLEGK